MRLSLIDFAMRHDDQTIAEALEASLALARIAEASGRYERIWYTEHHNMPSVISSSPAVLIGQIAAQTSTIRLGSGGVMLPNHSPLVIAEQFGTLAELHPGRIDLGLGRAPGTDPITVRALRRNFDAADNFPQDVVELAGYLNDETQIDGINAYPGRGTRVPIYILGSSLFGAQLAARLGLPYSFASHFSPGALTQAVAAYRAEYQPSDQHPEPYVIAACNAVVGETQAQAHQLFDEVVRWRVRTLVAQNPNSRGRHLEKHELDALLDGPVGNQARTMQTYTAVGTTEQVGRYLERFAEHAGADEVMIAPAGPSAAIQQATVEAVGTLS